MLINISYRSEFVDLLNKIAEKYGEGILELESINSQLDFHKFSKEFFNTTTAVADASVDPNSNVEDLNVSAYYAELPKPALKINALYILWKRIYKDHGLDVANETITGHIIGDYYINDLLGVSNAYCFNFATYDIATKGMPFISKIKSEKPKHLSSFIGQLIHFSVYASNSVLGAVGLADMLIVSAYYVDKLFRENEGVPDEFLWKQVKQELQSFIYSCNQPFRGGNQSGFYNVSIFDDNFLDRLCNDYVFGDLVTPKKETAKRLQEMFLDLMNETLSKTPVTFPVVTACFSVNGDKEVLDGEFLDMIVKKNKEFGFVNLFFGKTSTLSSCCRLRSETDNPYFNQFGAGGTKIGSLGVVTINLPRIAYLSYDKDEFIHMLKLRAEDVCLINNTKRELIKHGIDTGFQPLYKHGFMDLSKQYSTIGINGLNEALEIMGYDVLTDEGQRFVIEILESLNQVAEESSKEYNSPHNVEQTPSENSAIKLARKDREILGEIAKSYPLYSNQFIPLTTKANMLDRIELQGKFDSLMSGGAICHINLGEKIEDEGVLKDLYKHIAKSGTVYVGLNYVLKRCEEGHMTVSPSQSCDICGSKITDEYLRVVGFLTNTKNWHKVRREVELPNRQFYGDIL